ncbi:hypothetical protein PV08_02324 [Exophiala spinifera]|uniref:LysM domain-containing protein n=1 Tax=Exophiala spinifera TaxID=91928 RepID=A0A0D1ZZE3_9EURO|nr:uncharacterized protein PV08_02324 [Exophiala spinifera]KIW18037.1 hypothetical protein PV08_02324 [Exophiala spinifera]
MLTQNDMRHEQTARPSCLVTILALALNLIIFGAYATASYDSVPTTFITSTLTLARRYDTGNSKNASGGTPYTVVAGDTAYSISTRFGISLSYLTATNDEAHIDNWDFLQPGLVLWIPLPSTPTVASNISTGSPPANTGTIYPDIASITSPGSPPATTGTVYTVQQGDTGEVIASKVNKPFAAISVANPTATWTQLSVGETLEIPQMTTATLSLTSLGGIFLNWTSVTNTAAPTSTDQLPSPSTSGSYTVSSGDTGNIIALKAGLSFEQLSAANPGLNWSALTPGQVLTLPPPPGIQSHSATTPTTTNSPLSLASAVADPGSGLLKLEGALATKQIDLANGRVSAPDVYTFYSGDGSVEAGWPPMSQWLSYDALLHNVKPYIGQNCINNVPGNTPDETTQVLDSIITIANETDVDPRFILAVVMQESNGCVRVATTAVSNANPGLMQSYEGKASCDMNGVPVSPCPQASIYQMIVDGTAAQVDGPTLINALNKAQQLADCEPAQAFYRASRLYNSGLNSLQTSLDLGSETSGTRCYASDIANRLTGWVNGATVCFLR